MLVEFRKQALHNDNRRDYLNFYSSVKAVKALIIEAGQKNPRFLIIYA